MNFFVLFCYKWNWIVIDRENNSVMKINFVSCCDILRFQWRMSNTNYSIMTICQQHVKQYFDRFFISSSQKTNDDSNESNHAEYLKNATKRPTMRQRSNLIASSLLLVLFFALIPLSLASVTCKHHEYWDVDSDACIKCTRCNKHQIVIRPCQPHMDTLCKHLNAVEIDWSKSMASEKPSKHHHPTADTLSPQASTLSEDEEIWNWQMVSLVLAFGACLLFFVGTALISINYIRQWRKIKKEFDTGKFRYQMWKIIQKIMAKINGTLRNW